MTKEVKDKVKTPKGGANEHSSPFKGDEGAEKDVVLTQNEMKRMLKDLAAQDAKASFDECCQSIQPCSQDIAKIAEGIEDLCKQKRMQYVGKVADMEQALTDKCHEIKRQKGIVKSLLS